MISTKDVSYLDYLRGRPFLVILSHIQPVSGARTERRGWKKRQSEVAEHPSIAHRISAQKLRTAAVIIDLLNDRVVKNRFKSDATMFDDEALAHFKAKYADMISSARYA